MLRSLLRFVCLLLATLWMITLAIGTHAVGLQVVDAYYRFDVSYPFEFVEYFKDMSPREWALNLRQWEKPLAGSVHVYIKNNGKTPSVVEDIKFAGVNLKRAIAFSDQDVRREADPASIFFSDLTESERKKLIAAGDPIWWRVRPSLIQPGEIGEVTIRFRTNPPGKSVKLALVIKGERKPFEVVVSMNPRPRFEYISFSRDFQVITAFCSLRQQPPTRILINGKDITSTCNIVFDPEVSICPSVAKLSPPLKRGSYCCIQAVYPDGSKATELVKVWSDEPAYGMWGGMPGRAGDRDTAKKYFDDLTDHNINTQMEQIGSDCVIDFLKSREGRDYIASIGIRRTVNEYMKQGTTNPYLYFLADEPESADFYVEGVPPQYKTGCLAQGMVNKAQSLHERDPATPSGMNINYTFRPHSTYVYGLIPDILMCDPYYQPRIMHAYDRNPKRMSIYSNAKCIYALTHLPRLACMPRPLHMVLYANSPQSRTGEAMFRYPTPEEKRVEVYYALAGGAKQISYWWYTPQPPGVKGANGCGSEHTAAKKLWREIGLIGAEFGTVSHLIADSCPTELKVFTATTTANYSNWNDLWIRTLLVGTNTLILILVNENYTCDRLGTTYVPIEKADIVLRMPSWLKPRDVFKVTYKGISDVKWNITKMLNIRLDNTHMTRLIIVTADPHLRLRLQERYNERYASKVEKLLNQPVD
ncbi:MAG: hypothetical protein ACUVT8_05165 [Armatimonadota bacterium]